MEFVSSAIGRFGMDADFYRHGEDAPYDSARAIVAGFGQGGGSEKFDERGRESGVKRVLYLVAADAPPSARGGYIAVNGEKLLVERCEMVGCGERCAFWRLVAEVDATAALTSNRLTTRAREPRSQRSGLSVDVSGAGVASNRGMTELVAEVDSAGRLTSRSSTPRRASCDPSTCVAGGSRREVSRPDAGAALSPEYNRGTTAEVAEDDAPAATEVNEPAPECDLGGDAGLSVALSGEDTRSATGDEGASGDPNGEDAAATTAETEGIA